MQPSRVLIWSLFAALLPLASGAAEGFKIVANKDVPVNHMSKSEVARVFMKKQIEWSNGTPAAPVDQSTVSLVRAAFTQEVHEQKTSAIARYWQRQIFTGRGVPPTIRDSDADVLAFVQTTPGAIGYVAADAPAEGVKTIAVD